MSLLTVTPCELATISGNERSVAANENEKDNAIIHLGYGKGLRISSVSERDTAEALSEEDASSDLTPLPETLDLSGISELGIPSFGLELTMSCVHLLLGLDGDYDSWPDCVAPFENNEITWASLRELLREDTKLNPTVQTLLEVEARLGDPDTTPEALMGSDGAIASSVGLWVRIAVDRLEKTALCLMPKSAPASPRTAFDFVMHDSLSRTNMAQELTAELLKPPSFPPTIKRGPTADLLDGMTTIRVNLPLSGSSRDQADVLAAEVDKPAVTNSVADDREATDKPPKHIDIDHILDELVIAGILGRCEPGAALEIERKLKKEAHWSSLMEVHHALIEEGNPAPLDGLICALAPGEYGSLEPFDYESL